MPMKPEDKAYFETWQVSRFWAISRFKGKTNRGSCYPLRITWDAPVGRAFVLNYCREKALAGEGNFKGFRYFECHVFTPS